MSTSSTETLGGRLPPSRPTSQLVILVYDTADGTRKVEQIELHPDSKPVPLGRASIKASELERGVRIVSQVVSKEHGMFENRDGTVYFTDMCSTHGSRLRRRPHDYPDAAWEDMLPGTAYPLYHGDQLLLAKPVSKGNFLYPPVEVSVRIFGMIDPAVSAVKRDSQSVPGGYGLVCTDDEVNSTHAQANEGDIDMTQGREQSLQPDSTLRCDSPELEAAAPSFATAEQMDDEEDDDEDDEESDEEDEEDEDEGVCFACGAPLDGQEEGEGSADEDEDEDEEMEDGVEPEKVGVKPDGDAEQSPVQTPEEQPQSQPSPSPSASASQEQPRMPGELPAAFKDHLAAFERSRDALHHELLTQSEQQVSTLEDRFKELKSRLSHLESSHKRAKRRARDDKIQLDNKIAATTVDIGDLFGKIDLIDGLIHEVTSEFDDIGAQADDMEDAIEEALHEIRETRTETLEQIKEQAEAMKQVYSQHEAKLAVAVLKNVKMEEVATKQLAGTKRSADEAELDEPAADSPAPENAVQTASSAAELFAVATAPAEHAPIAQLIAPAPAPADAGRAPAAIETEDAASQTQDPAPAPVPAAIVQPAEQAERGPPLAKRARTGASKFVPFLLGVAAGTAATFAGLLKFADGL